MLKSKGERVVPSLKRKSIIEQAAKVKRLNSLSGNSPLPPSSFYQTSHHIFFSMHIFFLDVQLSIAKLKTVLNDTEVNLLSALDVPLRCYLNKSTHHCWKLVILSLDCDEAGELLRKWFGLHTVTDSSDGVTKINRKTC